MIADIDKEGSGTIDYADFLNMMTHKMVSAGFSNTTEVEKCWFCLNGSWLSSLWFPLPVLIGHRLCVTERERLQRRNNESFPALWRRLHGKDLLQKPEESGQGAGRNPDRRRTAGRPSLFLLHKHPCVFSVSHISFSSSRKWSTRPIETETVKWASRSFWGSWRRPTFTDAVHAAAPLGPNSLRWCKYHFSNKLFFIVLVCLVA